MPRRASTAARARTCGPRRSRRSRRAASRGARGFAAGVRLLPLPEGAPANRLGMAQWLVAPDHPLTARVTVNRYWSMFFGKGIVPTIDDFGTRGARPSHPELLDWLARDFVDHGWDIKRTIKQIMMSATYRQAPHVTEQKRLLDPENILLSRGPRRRHQGEFIRDNALMLAGILNDRVGGPSVKPYQPPRIWNEVSLDGNLKYKRDDGKKLYRRSMYTYWKRSAPMPNMMAFDAPTREKCVIQRQVTNTPLQALVTMNDPVYLEAAMEFAKSHKDKEAKDAIREMYQKATFREGLFFKGSI